MEQEPLKFDPKNWLQQKVQELKTELDAARTIATEAREKQNGAGWLMSVMQKYSVNAVKRLEPEINELLALEESLGRLADEADQKIRDLAPRLEMLRELESKYCK